MGELTPTESVRPLRLGRLLGARRRREELAEYPVEESRFLRLLDRLLLRLGLVRLRHVERVADGVEVTEEMIDAGLDTILDYEPGGGRYSEKEALTKIYRSMDSARLGGSGPNKRPRHLGMRSRRPRFC